MMDISCKTLSSATILYLLGALLFHGLIAPAHGQPPQPSAPSVAGATGGAVTSAPEPAGETAPGSLFLFIAYGTVWIALFGYVAYVGSLQLRARRDLERLEKILGKIGTSE